MSQTAVVPVHCASETQAAHFPVLTPLPTQTPVRHCVDMRHVPSPIANPQRLSLLSQIAEAHARAARAPVQVPPGTACPLLVFAEQVPGNVTLLHQAPPWQSLSCRQFTPQAPVARLQNCVAAAQARVLVLPEFPLHATHVLLVASHSGVTPLHWALLVHATQWLLPPSQAGVPPPQSAALLQSRHLPLLVPAVTHTPARHCASVAHVPSPAASPQRLSTESHAPPAHVRLPSRGLHVPPGTDCPFAAFVVQAKVAVMLSQKVPVPQSLSCKQSVPQAPVVRLQNGVPTGQVRDAAEPALPLHPTHALLATSHKGVRPLQFTLVVQATHRLLVLLQAGVAPPQSSTLLQPRHLPTFAPPVTHTPVRHCALPVQVSAPGASPHRASAVSQMPLAQARAATASRQIPPGTDCPLGVFSVQLPAVVTLSHQLIAAHCASAEQLGLQTPVPVSQKVFAPAGHAAVAALPVSPLQAMQALVAVLQTGVAPEQFALVLH